MMASVIAGYMNPDVLQIVSGQMLRPESFIIVESLTDIRTERVTTPNDRETIALDPTHYEEGRLFDTGFELYWKRLRAYPSHIPPFRVRLICEQDAGFSIDSALWKGRFGQPPKALPLKFIVEENFVLWGEAVRNADGSATGAWYEKEVPRLFRYPVLGQKATSRVALVSRRYRLASQNDNESGDLVMDKTLHRFCAIVPETEAIT